MTLPSQSAGHTLGWRIHYIAGTVNEFEVYGPDDNYLPDQSKEASLALAEHINGLAAENSKLKGQLEEAVKVLELPLMFYSPSRWDNEKRQRWAAITGDSDATTRVMCDTIRSLLAKLKEAGS